MSQASDDRLQFSINESVWLREDAPAEEILSMALEPDITVEEKWNDVTIRGFLRLTGEYKPGERPEREETDRVAPLRTIDEIMETESGTAVLEHHFPVDITIPANRVPDLENLFVVIESFDYDLSEQRHIRLQADIAITGLAAPESARKEKKAAKSANVGNQAAQPKAKPAEATTENKLKQDHAAAKAKQTEPAAENKTKQAKAAKKKTEQTKGTKKKTEQTKPAAKKTEQVKPVQEKKKEQAPKENKSEKQSLLNQKQAGKQSKNVADQKKEPAKSSPSKKQNSSPAAKPSGPATESAAKPEQPAAKGKAVKSKAHASKASREPESFDDIETIFAGDFDEMPTDRQPSEDESSEDTFYYESFREPGTKRADEEPQVAFSERAEQVPASGGAAQPAANSADKSEEPPADLEPAAETTPDKAQAEEGDTPTSSGYLTKLLAGEASEQQAKIRICIVQEGDSLESISDRYHVPVTSLLRRNALTSANIEKGELLYIPKSTKAPRND
ncbi:MAG: LysM peptidoglycan-binding domain-containing protein [Sporolactobacillus sp.]|jgi:stage VI sporulation protein D|nr:LysM peptidoglycan-binding domain-containing protein [Sporolactobacillus sp.]